MSEAARQRFGETAERVAEHAAAQIAAVREQIERLVRPRGDERALDVGTGAGVLALALAPLVREVVGVDVVPKLLEAARRDAPENATFVEGDAAALPFGNAAFDLLGCRRTVHHVHRPELVVAELTRVARPGAKLMVDDQIAPVDPLDALELDRFERARDPAHERTLPVVDFRHLFEANDLVLEQAEIKTHRRPLGYYLDLAGCEGEARERATALSPGGSEAYEIEIATYVLVKR